MSNIREVAKVAGVSIATVSRALSNPEKVSEKALKKVQDAIDQIGYKPNMLARNFRFHRSYAILVLVPDLANPFFSTVVKGIEDVARKKGFNVLLGDSRDSLEREQEYLKLIDTRQADGVIQLRPHREGDESTFVGTDFPVVNACGCVGTPYPSVRIDNAAAQKTVVDYLISLGHTRIGAITGLSDNAHSKNRLKGYKAALEQAGIPYDDKIVIEGDYSKWSGLNAATQFTHMDHRPTAVVAFNDQMAIGAVKGFKSAGLSIPEDISVTGFDDLEVAKYIDPTLTTIAQPATELGHTAMNLLHRMLEGQELSQQEYILPHEFMVRESTAAPKR
ncbi:LacI family transcriptional regulator [Saccharobesus litoralis]|uniref:LacI family transcriptional regulator n=1 Tax=Saccharobesus litoralis TaxID=2172099 RepID=A0A2S0VP53_9ALTE|nr:LacI family DNA-binding transcriptional regulator [Saccharobesus litoralis]AWB65988.1 LacI family transcriptional regulator [Saccharobesus litoralis]